MLDQLSCLESKSRWLGYHFSEIMNSLKIQIPSIEKQKNSLKRKREKIKELEKQIDQIEERSGAELKKDFDFLEHAIKSPVFKITSSTKLLKSFVSNLDKRFSEELKKTFRERYDEKIEDFLAGLISAATEIPKIVNTAKTRAQFSLKQYPNKEYSYKEVVAHIERTVKKIKNRNYNISVENNLDQKTRDFMYTAWAGFMRKELVSYREINLMNQEIKTTGEEIEEEIFNMKKKTEWIVANGDLDAKTERDLKKKIQEYKVEKENLFSRQRDIDAKAESLNEEVLKYLEMLPARNSTQRIMKTIKCQNSQRTLS